MPDYIYLDRHTIANDSRIIDADIELLSGILDRVGVPTHQHRQPLSFHQRVAVLAGMYEGTLKEFGAALRR